MPMPTSPLARLGAFRTELHACFPRRADALFELGDALLCAEAFPSLPHLSLEPAHRRGWGSVYAALARGRIDEDRLRDLLVGCLPDADPPVFAVDVTTWPRCDAECSPERGYYYHPSRHSAGRSSLVGPSSGSPSSALTGTPGPPRWMPAACTRWRTPIRPPPRRSVRCVAGCPPARPCRCSSSTAATTPLSSPWIWPQSGWRCWCGCAQIAASTPTRTSGAFPQGRPAAPPRGQVRLRRPDHLADPKRQAGLPGRPVRHRDRAGVGLAASQAAAPPQPRHP